MLLLFNQGSSGQNVPVSTSSETCSALSIAITIVVALGAASETNASQPASETKTVQISYAAESDIQDIDYGSDPIGYGGEGLYYGPDCVLTVINPRSYPTGSSSESDGALAVSISNPRSYATGTSAESDSSLAVSIANPRSYGTGAGQETDSSQAVTVITARIIGTGTASESDTSLLLQVANPRSYGTGASAESDSGLATAVANPRSYQTGSAAELDSVQVATVSNPRSYQTGIASESDTSQPVSISGTRTIQLGGAWEDQLGDKITYGTDDIALGQESISYGSSVQLTIWNPRIYSVGLASEVDGSNLVKLPRTCRLGAATEINYVPSSGNASFYHYYVTLMGT